MRVYAQEIEILGADGAVLRRHARSAQPGYAALGAADRIFNPSRETARLLARVAKIGPCTARFGDALFATLGRPGQKALYGLANLARRYRREDIEAVCEAALAAECRSYRVIKRALERRMALATPTPLLTQTAPEIRAISDYQGFFDQHTKSV